ncbi:MAG TPA: hypothetical protein VMQ44_01330 [Candidatus Saccharimonadales bacterium]|nr:hypothetical protein [Candidatus Saccharimonadales bacterium]
MEKNSQVVHPRELLKPKSDNGFIKANHAVLDFFANNVLASMIMFDIALIVPLLIIPLPDSVKITLGVISGSWIQWWALHAIQRTNMKADQLRAAKADADHQALTHIANTVDEILKNSPKNS